MRAQAFTIPQSNEICVRAHFYLPLNSLLDEMLGAVKHHKWSILKWKCFDPYLSYGANVFPAAPTFF